jgi:anti-sigma factor RsiW
VNADEPIRPDRPDPLVPESTGSGASGIDADGDWAAEGGHLGWRLSALLDGELPVADELRAREHLTSCDLCQDEFAEVMSARAFVRGLGEVEPPQDYLDRVMTRIDRKTHARLGLITLVAFMGVWIVLLLVAALVVAASN